MLQRTVLYMAIWVIDMALTLRCVRDEYAEVQQISSSLFPLPAPAPPAPDSLLRHIIHRHRFTLNTVPRPPCVRSLSYVLGLVSNHVSYFRL
ncbi:hypothetical protein BDV95DRAFT_561880 [Massariosphaeria phaeospora]|uniref:Secreted protein n=1 Tax=Massariosphaeria phaeospora TaxID=100035 RepID=A0A7C8MHC6_9PLEO|nr:hypothetical protein BDV95DRAFT_561880 [Massariosphaeria phaeospora]